MSIRPQLIDTLILHGAVRALEARGFSPEQITCLLMVEVTRLANASTEEARPTELTAQAVQ